MAKGRARQWYEDDGETVWRIITYKKGGARAKPDEYPLGICHGCGEGRRLKRGGSCPQCGAEIDLDTIVTSGSLCNSLPVGATSWSRPSETLLHTKTLTTYSKDTIINKSTIGETSYKNKEGYMMPSDRYLSIVYVLVIVCCFSIGCDDMQKPVLDVMNGADVDLPEGYLSLASENPVALTPINDSSEWAGWEKGTWEKVKDGELPPQPAGFDVSARFLTVFDHWFFSYANSKMDFDLTEREYTYFECSVVRPHLCSGGSALEVTWLADDVEVYKSNAITTKDVLEISFYMPVGIKKLTLKVIDTGDGSCSHFILGNTRLTFDSPEPEPVMEFTETFLSLASQRADAITPINDSSEWTNWEEGTWEKVKDEALSERPSNAFSVSSSFLNAFDYWFFSHAESKFDFHLKDRDYVYFEGAVVRPHLCGGGAAIDVIWLADGVQVYKTGAITTKDIIKMEFEIPVGTKTLTLKVADVGDGSCNHYILGNTRLLLEVPEGKGTYTGAYLSHYSESENAIRPTNHSNDWTHHNDGTWEKILDGETTKRISGFLDWDVNTFQHWIYAAVRSFMEFDLSGHNFVYFDSAVLLPNPCDGRATIQFYCLADDIEIYDSGVITGEAITRVGFDIPAGTRKLTLIVTDADDGRHCDHYVLGNPRFYTERPADAPPPQVGDVDPYRSLPEIARDAELTPGRYRIRTASVARGNYKIARLHKAIGDPDDRVEVRILLHPQPWSETAGGERVIGYTTQYGESAPDEVVIEITRQIRVYTEQAGRHTNTIYEYEGELIKNLSKPEISIEYEVIEPEPYLVILTESGEAILPSNYGTEWSGWGEGTWGKVKGEAAPLPPGGFISNPPVETFEHWFYSHAPSQMVFELGMRSHTYFDSFVVLPNPCGTTASVEIIWLADGMEVYNSGIVTGGDIWRVGFDIPAGTQTLTLQVTDAGDRNNCDHFIIGNPTLHLEKPVYDEVVPDPALDPDHNLPEIFHSAEIAPGNYRITPTSVRSTADKISDVGRYIGDPSDRVSIRILLKPQPWSETLDGHQVIGSQIVDGRNVRDQLVVEIIKKVRVITETRGGRAYTVHEYEGIAIKNLTNPQNIFEYGDR